jgi:uncharacterized membrane protein required for colicin V production
MSDSNRARPVFLCWFICIGSLATYSWANDDRVTAVVLGVLGVAGVSGYCVGATVICASSVTIVLTAMFPAPVEQAFGPAFADFFGTSGVLHRVLTISLAAVLLSLLAMLIAEVVWNRLMEKRLKLLFFNRSLGLLLGAALGFVVCVGFLGGSLVAEPYARAASASKVRTVQDFIRHCAADSFARTGAGARKSHLYPVLERANPFERVPSLKELSRLPGRDRTSLSQRPYTGR